MISESYKAIFYFLGLSDPTRFYSKKISWNVDKNNCHSKGTFRYTSHFKNPFSRLIDELVLAPEQWIPIFLNVLGNLEMFSCLVILMTTFQHDRI